MIKDDSYDRIDRMWAIKAEEAMLPPPYTLRWEFSNGHGWQHSFDERGQMEMYMTKCGLRSHPNITKLSFTVGATGKTVVLAGTIEELTT
jgi:hypothetical protein